MGDNGFSYSINQSAKEALYVPTTRDEKYKAKAFIDMFVQRFAKALAVGVSLAITAVFQEFATIRWLTAFTVAVGLHGAVLALIFIMYLLEIARFIVVPEPGGVEYTLTLTPAPRAKMPEQGNGPASKKDPALAEKLKTLLPGLPKTVSEIQKAPSDIKKKEAQHCYRSNSHL